MKSLEVAMGDATVSETSDTVLITFVGSCVALCLFDSATKIGGLAHVMLPEIDKHIPNQKTNGKYADQAIDYLLDVMQKKGAKLRNIKAKIVGGAQIFASESGNSMFTIGKRNIESIKKNLKSNGIPILAEETGKTYGRWVKFNVNTAAITVKSKKGDITL